MTQRGSVDDLFILQRRPNVIVACFACVSRQHGWLRPPAFPLSSHQARKLYAKQNTNKPINELLFRTCRFPHDSKLTALAAICFMLQPTCPSTIYLRRGLARRILQCMNSELHGCAHVRPRVGFGQSLHSSYVGHTFRTLRSGQGTHFSAWYALSQASPAPGSIGK